MTQTTQKALAGIVLVTCAVWSYSSIVNTLHMREFWFYCLVFMIPTGLLCGSVWLMERGRRWIRLTGFVSLMPTFVIWCFSLLFVYGDFKLH